MNRLLRPRSSLLLPLLLTAGSLTMTAQESGKSTFGNGAVHAADSRTILTGTIGQPIAGAVAASHARAWQGFWSPAYARPSSVEAVAGEARPSVPSLRCSPNPVSGSATIHASLPDVEGFTLTLHDLLGREVMSLTEALGANGGTTVNLDATELESGWYTIVLDADETVLATLPVRVVR